MKRNKFFKIVIIFIILTVVNSCNFEREVKLGGGYYLFGNGANTSISKEESGKVGVYDDIIIGEIIDYSYNNNYILVYRKVTEKCELFFYEHDLWTKENNTPKNQFWIIDKINNRVFGPLGFIEYLKLKKTKGIEITLNV